MTLTLRLLVLLLVLVASSARAQAPTFSGRAPFAPGPPDACSGIAISCGQIDDFNLTLRAAGLAFWPGPGFRYGGGGSLGATLSFYKSAELGLSLPIAVLRGEGSDSAIYGPPELRLRLRIGPRLGPSPWGKAWPESEPYPKALPASYDVRPGRWTAALSLRFVPLWPGVRGQGPPSCSASDSGCLAEVGLSLTGDLRLGPVLATGQIEATTAGDQSQLRAGGRVAVNLFDVAALFAEGRFQHEIAHPTQRGGLALVGWQFLSFRSARFSIYYGRAFGGVSGEHLAGVQLDLPIGLLWGLLQRLSEAVDPFVAADGWIYDDQCAPLFRLGRSIGREVRFGGPPLLEGGGIAVGTHLWRRGNWLYHDAAATRPFIQIPRREGTPAPIELNDDVSPWPDAAAARRSEAERARWLRRYALAPDPRRRALCAELLAETVAALTRAALQPTLAERCAQARRDQAEAIAYLSGGGYADHSGAWAAGVGHEGYVRAVCNDQISLQALGALASAVRPVGGLTVAGARRPPPAGTGVATHAPPAGAGAAPPTSAAGAAPEVATHAPPVRAAAAARGPTPSAAAAPSPHSGTGAQAIPVPPAWFPPDRIPPSRQLSPGPARIPPGQQLAAGPQSRAALPPGPAAVRQLPAHAPAPSAKAAAIANWRRGTNFNRAHAFDYPYREVPVVNPAGGPGLRRVDGYHPNYVIVSRKMTQLAEVKEETALRYLRELRDKYPGGRPIANVPSSGPLAGTRLIGRQILEVPIQEKPVPQRVVQEAANLGIIIRDVDGKEYR